MTNEEICVWLKAEAEPKFQKFTSGLIPGTDPIIGVRIPKLRTLAKKIAKEDWRGYLEHAACDTYEEIMLQGLVLGYAKGEIDELLEYVRAFIPKIHDWSVNDCFCATFKIAQKHREKVAQKQSLTDQSWIAFVQLLKLRRNTAKKSGIF